MLPQGGIACGGARLAMTIREEENIQGVAYCCMPAGQMEYWLAQGWSEHQIRHWYSLRKVKRDEAGNIMRSKAIPTKSQDKM
eukprot:7923733-Pyramimonas_sp.AAC.1